MDATPYDLFLDESGTFRESSLDEGERRLAKRRGEPDAPSQLCGLLVPRGTLPPEGAEGILAAAHRSAGVLLASPFHASNLSRGPRFDGILLSAVEELRLRGFQPVRLVNREGVAYGDRSSNYVNLVAELVIRILEEKAREGEAAVSLRLTCATVFLGENPDGTPRFLPEKEYLKRLHESLAFTAVRRGEAAGSSRWRIDPEFRCRSVANARELQLCDLLSNGSFDDFRKAGPSASEALAAAFGRYDFSLSRSDAPGRVDALVENKGYGIALIVLAGRLASPSTPEWDRRELSTRLDRLLRLLVSSPPGSRAAHLQTLTTWLRQVIESAGLPDTGYRIARWLLERVGEELKDRAAERNCPSLDTFVFTLRLLALSACNARGALADGRRAAEEMERALPSLAGQWEQANLIMEGIVARAAHDVDCFDHEGASASMALVDDYYGTLSGLLADARPDLFPKRVRSEVRGKAIAARMTAELHRGLADPPRLALARELSARAIDEFPSDGDRSSQFAPRCHLEAAAGDFPEARRFLSLSLSAGGERHEDLAAALRALPESRRGFPLLHWLRMGAFSTEAGGGDGEAFLAALRSSGLLRSRWISDPSFHEYPAHGCRRFAAQALAAGGERKESLSILGRLLSLDPGGEGRILHALLLPAAQAAVAAHLLSSDPAKARELLDGRTEGREGARLRLATLRIRFAGEFELVRKGAEPLERAVTRSADPSVNTVKARRDLLGAARAIAW